MENNEQTLPYFAGGAEPLPEKIPPPTVWPATMALGVTFMAFGIVTQWIMSVGGFALFIVSIWGWAEDLRNDGLQ